MGIVYEAEQISMGRRVALKVLPLAGLVDELKIQRFENEVRAVATLDHPHIVSVYTVGEERGIHYFAMQLIRGRSLDQVISSLRDVREEGKPLDGKSMSEITSCGGSEDASCEDLGLTEEPANRQKILTERDATVAKPDDSTIPGSTRREYFRSVAALGIQAASALEHAHNQGVIHRDVKPANLLLDRSARLYVTDFGLARVEADAGITMAGDLVGTLRYMAPEQALAQHGMVDHRADIYSLAVSLYELLALQPAYPTADRRLLLKQIAFEEPASLRRLDPKIPSELEVIVQKGMSKEIAERYRSAQELADDLRLFLDNRPIKARPPTLIQVATKWARRNPAIAWATIITLLLATIAFGITSLLVAQQRDTVIQVSESLKANLYEAEMSSAYEAWESGNLALVEELLRKQIPEQGQKDRRGFEWYYLADLHLKNDSDSLWFDKRITDLAMDTENEVVFALLENREVLQIDLAKRDMEIILQSYDEVFAPHCVAFCTETQMLAIGGRVKEDSSAGGGKIEVRNMIDGVCYDVRSDSIVRNVAFSTDGKWAASRDVKGTTKVWNAATGNEQWNARPLAGAELWRGAIAFSPDGKTLVAAYYGHVFSWNVETGDKLGHFDLGGDGYLRDVAFNPDGTKLAVVGATFHMLDASNLASEEVIGKTGLETAHQSVAFSPDGKQIAVGNHGNAIIVWDLETNQVIKRHLHRELVHFLAYSRDGAKLFSASLNEIRISRDTDVVLEVPFDVPLAVEGNSIAICDPSNEVLLWDFDKSETHRFAGHQAEVMSIAISSDTRLLASGDREGFIRTWDTETKKQLNEFKLTTRSGEPTPVRRLACSPTNDLLLAARDSVSGWNLKTGEALWSGVGHVTEDMLFSPDGQLFAAGGDKGALHGTADDALVSGYIAVWNVDGSPRQLQRVVHDGFVVCLAYWESPDGSEALLAAGDLSTKITVFDARTMQKKEPTLSGHTIHLTALAFSPDGKTLISGSWDGTMRMWSVATGRQVGLIRNPNLDVSHQAVCLPSTPRKRRFLTVVGAFGLHTLTIREINLVDPDLPWAPRGRGE